MTRMFWLMVLVLPITVATAAPLPREYSFEVLDARVKARFGKEASLWRADSTIRDNLWFKTTAHRPVARWQIWRWMDVVYFDDGVTEPGQLRWAPQEILLGDGDTFAEAFEMASRRDRHFPIICIPEKRSSVLDEPIFN